MQKVGALVRLLRLATGASREATSESPARQTHHVGHAFAVSETRNRNGGLKESRLRG